MKGVGTLSIGVLVRRERRQRGLTQDQLATLTGISQTKISKLENNQKVDLDLGALASLSNHLGIPMRKLKVGQQQNQDLNDRVTKLEMFSETIVRELEELRGLVRTLSASAAAE